MTQDTEEKPKTEMEALEIPEIEAHLRSRQHGRRWVQGLILATLAIAALLVALYFFMARPALQRLTGQISLYYGLGTGLKDYAADHHGMFPPLSSEPGRLMHSVDALYPEYCSDLSVWTFPGEAALGTSSEELVDDHSYWYLGYAVTSDGEMEAFADAYLVHVAQGAGFDLNLEVAPGRGTRGGEMLYRLRTDLPELLGIKEPAEQSRFAAQVPVMIQRPVKNREQVLALFLDGHIASLPYPGQFPATPRTMAALERMDSAEKGR